MRLGDLAVLSPVLPASALVAVAVLGACSGVFANRLAWRMVRGENQKGVCGLYADHRCRLSVFGLGPALVRTDSRSERHRCGQRALVRHVTAGFLGAAYFASMVWTYGLTVRALALCMFGCVLLGLSLVDLDTLTIPNEFIIAGVVVWVASFAFFGVDVHAVGVGALALDVVGSPMAAVLVDGLAGAFSIAGALLALSFAFDKMIGGQSLGGGDIKLLFVVGLFLGVAASVLNLVVACVMGVVFSLATRRVRCGSTGLQVFPFGPSIALATWFTLVAGSSVLGWYFGFC